MIKGIQIIHCSVDTKDEKQHAEKCKLLSRADKSFRLKLNFMFIYPWDNCKSNRHRYYDFREYFLKSQCNVKDEFKDKWGIFYDLTVSKRLTVTRPNVLEVISWDISLPLQLAKYNRSISTNLWIYYPTISFLT